MNSNVTVSDFGCPRRLMGLADFFLASLGPRGTLKAFLSPAGHLTVTGTSQRVLHCLALEDAAAEVLVAAAKSFLLRYGDGGTSLMVVTAGMQMCFQCICV